jgi:pyruvate/2-oxoglutarate dehydrogenase complex dihydrolipoamide dehydrogenase (E3) component/uncharacterized membrane protein YdjX (TVP38/TMEM64 family)
MKVKIGLSLLILTCFGIVLVFDVHEYVTLAAAQAHYAALTTWVADFPLQAAGVYFTLYVLVTALALPMAVVFSLVGAALFGLWWSLLLVSFASSLGATLAFLMSRYLFKDWVQHKFGTHLQRINQGVAQDGAVYLLSLRLIPLVPFFLINLLFGLTSMHPGRFYLVSQLGMLPGTLIYLNAGTQLLQLRTTADILSPTLLGSLVLLGVFPLMARWTMAAWQRFQLYRRWSKPTQFDYNLVVIGAGAGGLVTTFVGAAVHAKVALIEADAMGGDCLNTGCVPSKTLIRIGRLLHDLQHAKSLGVHIDGSVRVEFAEVMQRVQQIIQQIAPHDSIERYTELGAECIQGRACIRSPWSVEVNGRLLTTEQIVIATGARPLVPSIPGLSDVAYLTSDTLWSLQAQPQRLLVLGGGPIGCELAQCFARLGSEVTLVEKAPQLLIREDPEVSDCVMRHLQDAGVAVLINQEVVSFHHEAGVQSVKIQQGTTTQTVVFDKVLLALGRVANVEGFGVEELGLAQTPDHKLAVNDYLQTSMPNIFAVGDVCGPYQLTHAAGHQGGYAAFNALFGRFKKMRVDYRVMPAVTYTDPEVARVGLNETTARAAGLAYEVTCYALDDLDRAIIEGATDGFVKVLTVKGQDTILGATIVGVHGGELLTQFTLAMQNKLGLKQLLRIIHPYPTLGEAVRYTASTWRQARTPSWLLNVSQGYHRWRRR